MTNSSLPRPAGSSSENRFDVLVYDGNCPFCCNQVARLARWDRRGELTFLSLHDPELQQLYPELEHDALMEAIHLVARNGKVYRGAAAFRVVARRLPRLWPLLPILSIPFSLPLWQGIYRLVARRRYKLRCGDDGCRVG